MPACRRALTIVVSLLTLLVPASAAQAALTVGGRVTGPGGTALAEARVSLLPWLDPLAQAKVDLAGTLPEPVALAASDAKGLFRLAAPGPGTWRVRVEAPGFVPREYMLTPLLENEELPDAEMVRDVGVSVKVARADGSPAAGAFVRAIPVRGRADRFGGGGGWRTASRVGRTGADGVASLARGSDETLSVGAALAGSAAWQENTRSGSIVLRMPGSAPRTLAVADPGRRPAAGVAVVTDTLSLPLGVTAADGTLRVAVQDGTTVRVAGAAGHAVATVRPAPAAGAAGTPERPQAIALDAPVDVAARVIDKETRKPVAGAVLFVPDTPAIAGATDARGAVSVRVPATHAATLRAQATGYMRDEIDVVAGRRPVLALAPAAAVEGIVVDGAGKPVGGAAVSLGRRPAPGPGGRIMLRIGDGDPFGGPRTRSGADGRFRLAPVEPEGSWDLRARATGFAPATTEIEGLQPYRTKRDVRVVLGASRAIVGRVVDAQSAPIAGATVEARRTPQGGPGGGRIMILGAALGPPAASALTDRDGRFRLDDLSSGSYDVEAARDGFAKRKMPGVAVAAEGEPTGTGDLVLEPGVAVEGYVRDADGQPIEGVGIRAATPGPGAFLPPGLAAERPDSVTGPDGYFRIDGHRAGDAVDVTAARTGYVSESRRGVSLPLTSPLEVTLRPASIVAGRVLDPDGRPVARAEVTLSASRASGAGQMMFSFRMDDGDRTDAEGAFRFDEVQPGRVTVSASAPGYEQAMVEAVEIKAGEDVTGLELRLAPGAWVEGQVLGPDGRPVIGADVSPVSGEGSFGGPGRGGAQTDGDGWYRIDGLSAGVLSLQAEYENLPRVVKDIELKPGANRLDLAFAGGVTVTGRVVDDAGAPLSGAAVALRTDQRFWGGAEATSGADGTFRLTGVGEGNYGVFAARTGYAQGSNDQRIDVKNAPIDNVVITLRPAGRIVGTVVGIDPADYGKVVIDAWRAERFARATATVDHQGKFVIDGVDAGTWNVTGQIASSGRQAKADVTIAEGQREVPATLEFGRGVVLSGVATQARRPVAGAMVTARGEDVSSTGWARTDDSGRFTIEGLEPGRYNVDLRQWDKGLSYATKVDLAASRSVDIEIPATELAGSVSDATDGSAIAGVSVTLLATGTGDEAPGPFSRFSAMSDQNGLFSIDGVPDGTYTLTTRKEGYAALNQALSVQGGRAQGALDLKLDATEGLTLYVRHASGRAPDEVFVAVLDASGRALSSSRYATGENGRVRLATVAPGSWEVLVGSGGSGSASLRATVPGAALQVTLPPSSRLRVTVPDLASSTTLATVKLTGADGVPYRGLFGWGGIVSEWRLNAGQATIEGLPPGSWTISVNAADGRSWSATAVTTAGGTADAVVK